MLEDQLFYLKLLEDQIVHAGILTPDIVTLLRRSRGKSWMVNSCFDGHEFIVHFWPKLVLWILQTVMFHLTRGTNKQLSISRAGRRPTPLRSARYAPLRCGFLFLYFHFCFLQKYIFVFEINRNIPGRQGPGRPAAGRQRLFCKKIHEKFALKPLEDRPSAAGRPGRQGPVTLYVRAWI